MSPSSRIWVLILALAVCWTGSSFATGPLPTPDQDYVLRFFARWASQAQVPDHPSLNLGASFTLEAWVYPEEQLDYGLVIGRDEFSWGYVLWLTPDGKPEFRVTGGMPPDWSPATGPTSVPLHQWTHLAGTSDGVTLRLYENGIEVATGPSPGAPDPNPPESWAIGRNFAGSIARARIWNRALSPAEIVTSASTASPVPGSDLLADWPLDDGFGRAENEIGGPFRALDVGPNALHALLGEFEGSGDDGTEPGWIRRDVLESGLPFFELTSSPSTQLMWGIVLIDLDLDLDLDALLFGVVPPELWSPILPFYVPPPPFPVEAYRFDHSTGEFVLDPSLIEPDDLQIVGIADQPVIADFDGDSLPDVLVADAGPDGLTDPPKGVPTFPGGLMRLLTHQGAGGGVADESSSRLDEIWASHVRTPFADVDNDDDLDFFADRFGGLQELCETLTPVPPAPCQAIYLNDGAGNFTTDYSRLPNQFRNDGFRTPQFLDVDGDGDPDLIGSELSAVGVPWFRGLVNDGTGSFLEALEPGRFPPLPESPYAYRSGAELQDLDGQFGPDLVIVSFQDERFAAPEGTQKPFSELRSRFFTFLDNGDGTYSDVSASIDSPIHTGNVVSFGDLDGDSLTDMVAGSGFGFPDVWLGTGGGGFQRAGRVFDAPYSSIPRLGDVDDDGDVDVVIAAFDSIEFLANPSTARSRGSVAVAEQLPEQSRVGTSITKPATRRDHLPGGQTVEGRLVYTSVWQGSVYELDLAVDPPAIAGPFLGGLLAEDGEGLLDIERIPGTHRVLVSAFGREFRGRVHRVDFSTPGAPELVDTLTALTYSSDLAVAPNGGVAMVTAATFGPRGPGLGDSTGDFVEVFDPLDFTTRESLQILLPDAEVACVAIGPGGRTAVFCDPPNQRIIAVEYQAGSGFISETPYPTSGRPNDVAIDPDGTVLVALVADSNESIDVFEVTGSGTLTFRSTVAGLPGDQQSIAIDGAENRAWTVSVAPSPDQLSWLDLQGPGMAALGGAGISDLESDADGIWLNGIESIEPLPGFRLAVSVPTATSFQTTLVLYDSVSESTTSIETGTISPLGMAFLPVASVFSDGFETGDTVRWSATTP